MQNSKLILASASPRRKELLSLLAIDFQVEVSSFDESQIDPTDASTYVTELASEKAKLVSKKFPDSYVLGADTIVVSDKGEFLGKPSSKADAKSMLENLKGTVHQVWTGFAIFLGGEEKHSQAIKTDVWMRELSDSEIDCYVQSNEPMDKAGAYAIQGIGASLVEKIDGSYTSVVGLPLAEVALALKSIGILCK